MPCVHFLGQARSPRTTNREPRSGPRGQSMGLIVLMASLIPLSGTLLGCDRTILQATAVSEARAGDHIEGSTVAPADLQAEMLTAIKAAEALVMELWRAVEVPTAPIESRQWLVAYFRQGWGPAMATALASFYSYADGEHLYLRYTDDVLPGIEMALAVTVVGLAAGEAAVQAEFPAIDGPVRYQASSRLYHVIQEEDTWKVAQLTVTLTGLPGPPAFDLPGKRDDSDPMHINSVNSRRRLAALMEMPIRCSYRSRLIMRTILHSVTDEGCVSDVAENAPAPAVLQTGGKSDVQAQ